mmetsp:Transcript_76187/g.184256  ORF Transcript_76187/g.184256 Transcript_76187/m.184256 type:complete len:277 (-) Transcript_76187:268-1098(-)
MSLLYGHVVWVHLGPGGEFEQGRAVVHGLAVEWWMGDLLEIKAQLLDERPLVVHAPLGHVLPLAGLRIALHEGLHQAGPARVAAGGGAIGRGPRVGASEDVRHGALVPVIVVALADTVRDVDADVREGAHLRKYRVPQGLLPDDAAPPRASVQVVLVEVLVNGSIDVAPRVPDLVGALDHEATGVEGPRALRDHKVGDQARVVERRGGHVSQRYSRGRHWQCVRCRVCSWRRQCCPLSSVGGQSGRQGSPKQGPHEEGQWNRHLLLDEVLPSAHTL